MGRKDASPHRCMRRIDFAATLPCRPAGGRGSGAFLGCLPQGFRLRPAGYAETGTPWASILATPPFGGVRYLGSRRLRHFVCGRMPAVFLSPAYRRGGKYTSPGRSGVSRGTLGKTKNISEPRSVAERVAEKHEHRIAPAGDGPVGR